MATKKKTAEAEALVAASTILVDGKAFEAGEAVIDVDPEQIERAVSDRRVITKAAFDALAQGVPAPDLTGHLDPADELAKNGSESEGEPVEGEGELVEGENGGSGE